jgi:hypothetical protein
MEKSIFRSRTFWGAVMTLVGGALNLGSTEVAQLTDISLQAADAISALVTAAGAVVAIYGRIKATKSVKLK